MIFTKWEGNGRENNILNKGKQSHPSQLYWKKGRKKQTHFYLFLTENTEKEVK